jgi:protein arginine kinase activator
MLCQICKQKEANGHFIQVLGAYKVLELHICEDCTRKMLESRRNSAAFGGKALPDWLEIITNTMEKKVATESVCPKCGKRFSQFVQSAYKGCPVCYSSFKTSLGGLVCDFDENDMTLDALIGDLNTAILEERYEDAAQIRDQIVSIKSWANRARGDLNP